MIDTILNTFFASSTLLNVYTMIFNFHKNIVDMLLYFPNFIEEETYAQRKCLTCPKLCPLLVEELAINAGSLVPGPVPWNQRQSMVIVTFV